MRVPLRHAIFLGQAVITPEIAERPGQLFPGSQGEFAVSDGDSVDMDRRACIEVVEVPEPGCKTGQPQGMDQRFDFIVENGEIAWVDDGKVHRAAAGMGAEAGFNGIGIGALRDGVAGEVYRAVIERLSIDQHLVGPLVELVAVDGEQGVII